MLEWLKNILGDAYSDEIDGKVSAEIGKSFVSRNDFNELSTAKKQLEKDLQTRDTQLENLSKSQGTTDDLKAEIEKLRKQNREDKEKYEADLAKLRMDNAVEAALVSAGSKNLTATKALLASFLEKAELEEDGTVKGLADEIEKLTKAETSSFLFSAKGTAATQTFEGMQLGNPGGNPPSANAANYESRLAEARKNGNTTEAVAIKREAADNGVFLM